MARINKDDLSVDISVKVDVTREMAERALAVVQWYCKDAGCHIEAVNGVLTLTHPAKSKFCKGYCGNYDMCLNRFAVDDPDNYWDKYGNLPGRCPGFEEIVLRKEKDDESAFYSDQ